MDPEMARSVSEAADIAASGRWAAVSIEQLAANSGYDDASNSNAWWVQLFGALCAEVFSEYLAMKRDYEEKRRGDAPLLAWRARNLLELSVWSVYCAKSRENARRVYGDAGRDARDVFNLFIDWGTAKALPAHWLDPLTDARQDLFDRAAAEGIDSLEGPYKAVSKAAMECGIREHFNVSYRMLSKFAHPTEMRILALPDEVKDALQRDYFLSQGCLFFTGGFYALEGQLLE
jgi:hypothetical protein